MKTSLGIRASGITATRFVADEAPVREAQAAKHAVRAYELVDAALGE